MQAWAPFTPSTIDQVGGNVKQASELKQKKKEKKTADFSKAFTF